MTVTGRTPRWGTEVPTQIHSGAGSRSELLGFDGLNQDLKFKVDWWAKSDEAGHIWEVKIKVS